MMLALELAIRAAVIISLAAGSILLMRRSSASARHLVWFLGIAGMLLLPALAAMLPRWNTLPRQWSVERQRDSAAALLRFTLHDTATVQPSSPTSAAGVQPAVVATSSRNFNSAMTVESIAGGLWCLVSAAMVARVGFSYHRLLLSEKSAKRADANERLLLRSLAASGGAAQRVRWLFADSGTMPTTWGVMQPRIFLPADAMSWPRARLQSVVLHEIAHVRRFDFVTQLVAEVACAIYWFNPLTWYATRQMRIERERACDDAVINSGTRGSDYAEDLLTLGASLRLTTADSMGIAMVRAGELERRLRQPGISSGSGPTRAVGAQHASSKQRWKRPADSKTFRLLFPKTKKRTFGNPCSWPSSRALSKTASPHSRRHGRAMIWKRS